MTSIWLKVFDEEGADMDERPIGMLRENIEKARARGWKRIPRKLKKAVVSRRSWGSGSPYQRNRDAFWWLLDKERGGVGTWGWEN